MNFTVWTGYLPSRWTLAILALVVSVLGVATVDRPMPAGEIDALAGGGVLVDAIFSDDRPLNERLRSGFRVDSQHPRAEDFARRKTWRRHLAEPPLPRWLAGVAILVAPEGVSDRDAAHWMAALLMALAALGAAWLGGWGGVGGAVAGIATLGSAAALDAAGGACAAAAAALSMAALLVACQRLLSRQGGSLAIGVAWGALLACHPAALFLVVPIFAAVAIAWPADSGGTAPTPTEAQPTALPLPAIPPALLAAPVVAVAFLVAIWPTLWFETGRHLAIWLTDSWWAVAPDQVVLDQAYHQPGGRAPAAYTATLQWLVWTPWPVLLAWLAGVGVTVREGRAGMWLPILVLATILLVGGADGGLFGARRSLLAWLWVPTAVTASVGLALLGRHAGIGVATACLAWALVQDPWGTANLGAEARGATPVSALEAIAEDDPGARVHVASSVPGQRHAVEVLRWRDGLNIHWGEPDDAQWAVVLNPPPATEMSAQKGPGEPTQEPWWSGQLATRSGQAGGVAAETYRRP